MKEYSFTVDESESFRRLDLYVHSKLSDISRTYIQKLIASGNITVNDGEVRGSYRPSPGDEIEVIVPEAREFHLVAEDIPLDVVHEDEELIVINKPVGMVVHPAPGHWDGTLVNALLHHVKDFRGIGGQIRPGLVHRLDKDTSGLLVVAKSDKSLYYLSDEMKERRIKRKYIAFIWGHMPADEGTIEAPIGRSRRDRTKMTVTEANSRPSITDYKVKSRYNIGQKLELSLQTGRTHQIRVHLSHVGHPVIGDPDYGGRETAMAGIFDQYRPIASRILNSLSRQALHAYKLSFKHPVSKLLVSFESELPQDLRKIEDILESEG